MEYQPALTGLSPITALVIYDNPTFQPVRYNAGEVGEFKMRSLLMLMLAALTPAIASGDTQLKGAVKDSSGASISGAMVLIHWDSAGSTVGVRDNTGIKADLRLQTNNNGTFNVDLPPGFYDVFDAAPAFTPACRKVRIKSGEPMEITFSINADPLYTAEMGNGVETIPRKH